MLEASAGIISRCSHAKDHAIRLQTVCKIHRHPHTANRRSSGLGNGPPRIVSKSSAVCSSLTGSSWLRGRRPRPWIDLRKDGISGICQRVLENEVLASYSTQSLVFTKSWCRYITCVSRYMYVVSRYINVSRKVYIHKYI